MPSRGFQCARGGLVALVSMLCLSSPVAGQRPDAVGPASFAERRAAWRQHSAMERDSLFRGLLWHCVGPVVQGGRVVDVEGIPGQPYSFYVAYASGGLWRTTNNGFTFEPLFDDQPTIIMGDIAVDPSNPSTVWVGTGENNSSRSSYGGYGVFRSDDAGATWKHVGLGSSDRIGRIIVDPRDSRRVHVAALGKLYTVGGERGVYRTTDGGVTWKQVLPGSGYTGAIDLVLDPSNPDVLYAATWERSRRPWDFVESGAGSAIWKSTDAGETWSKLAGGLPEGDHVGRIGLALCTSQPSTIYCCIDNQELLPEDQWDLGDSPVSAKRLRTMSKEEFLAQDPDAIESFIRSSDLATELDADKLIDMVENDEITVAEILDELDDANANLFQTDIRGLEVYRSDDAGVTWKRTHQEPLRQVVHTYGYYFGVIAVSPDDPLQVYTAGVPVLRSDDGGRHFKGINPRDVHVDHHAIWIDPALPSRIILGNDGGLDISYDRGESWRKVDSQPVGQFYTVTVDMGKPYNIYGGLQDNGTLKGSSRSRPGINEWESIGGGDGMYVQVDSRDGTTYLGYQFGFYTRIDPDGSRHTVRPRDAVKEVALRYNWSTPIQLSSHNEDIIYFGTDKLFRSMDQGEKWTALSPDLSRSGSRGDVPFACITTLDESTLEFGLIWVGTDDGRLYVTENSGSSWQAVSGGLPHDRWVTRITASREARERAYVSLSGYRDDDITSHVYVTDDLGKTWRSIAAGLPAEPVNVIKEDPVNGDVLYVGTDRGAYVSLDRGRSWQGLVAGLPSVPVHDLIVHPRDRELVAATHGRSVFVIDALPIQELTAELRESVVKVFPVEDITASRGWRGRRSRWFHDPTFDPEQRIPFWSGQAGSARLEVLDSEDRVLQSLEKEVQPGVHVFEWDLLLDAAQALPAEEARVVEEDKEHKEGKEKGKANGNEGSDDGKGKAARRPWAESIRLGHPLYITAGDYTLRVSIGDASSTTKLKVEAPDKREPRARPKPKIRGEKDD